MLPCKPLTFFALFWVFLIPGAIPAMSAKVTTVNDCEKSPFSGSWVSTDKTVPFLSKLEITDLCKHITTKPVATNTPWAGVLGQERNYFYREYRLRPSSTCYPLDCVWGRSKGQVDSNGALVANFHLFFSRRYLKLTWKKQALHINWRIQYLSGKKPDQIGETLLVRTN
ncbi:MAG: hypothetical protein GY927_21620 [bacterium]|nr:hypothetical protein [bacterium]